MKFITMHGYTNVKEGKHVLKAQK